jgi:hypothetical protein
MELPVRVEQLNAQEMAVRVVVQYGSHHAVFVINNDLPGGLPWCDLIDEVDLRGSWVFPPCG